MIKVGDTLKFAKFKWVVVSVKRSECGLLYAMYRVFRKYGRKYVTNTQAQYPIFPYRWDFLKLKLARNPNYHYTMSLWSNAERRS